MAKNICQISSKYKLLILLITIFVFAVIYLLYDDTNFSGISTIQETIKEELLKDKIQKEIKETFDNNNLYDKYYNDEPIIKGSKKEEKAIDDTTKKIKNVVKDKEIDVQKVKPSIRQRFFDRLYFSVVTGTTLGYGDIYPTSNSVKLLTMIQTLSTIILILI